MHTVIETPTFLHDCGSLTEDERLAIVAEIAANPQLGDVLKGTEARANDASQVAARERAADTGPSLIMQPTMFQCCC
jgi:hypothetical protein